MVFGPPTIAPNGFQWFSMVANLWSNNGMVTIHRHGPDLPISILKKVWPFAILPSDPSLRGPQKLTETVLERPVKEIRKIWPFSD